jgi:glycosyltransferase involved in cell wall biosynthesis
MKNLYYWSPCLSKVGTYKSTINSAISLAKFSKNRYSVKVINVCGEWDEEKDVFKKNNIELVDLSFKYFKFLPKSGFLKSRLSNLIIVLLSLVPLTKLLKKNKPDYLIAHLITSLPIIIFYLCNIKSKLILRISGFPRLNIIRKNLWKIFSKKIYKITCPSIDLMHQLDSFGIFPKHKLFFLPDPVINIRNFIKNKKNNNDQIKIPSKKYFISAGRLTKQKNFDYLINEFSSFVKNNDQFDLLIFGEGENKNYLKNLINKKNLNDKIFLMGFSSHIYYYMKKAEAFILSSLWEDPGFVIIESALNNLVVISSNCKNGPSEFLQNGKAGYLFENNQIGALKENLENFILNNKDIKEKKFFAKKNCLKYTLLRHHNLFKKVLED